MVDPLSTPGLPEPLSKPFFRPYNLPTNDPSGEQTQPFSSSPGFGTPAYPIQPRPPPNQRPVQLFATRIAHANGVPAVLPIELPPTTLRPIAFRTLTKKHNLTLTSTSLVDLATFVGKYCGSGWRTDGLAERVLDEVARSWKRAGGAVIIGDGSGQKLKDILKDLEGCMSGGRLDTGKLSQNPSNLSSGALSRQNSLNTRPPTNRDDSRISGVDVEDEAANDSFSENLTVSHDARTYLKCISAFTQPRLKYSTKSKSLTPIAVLPSLFPPITQKTELFRHRYNLVYARLLRNPSFQTPSFSTISRPPALLQSGSSATTHQNFYKITPISNLLGRSGSSHLLLGLLVHNAAGDIALADVSGSVVLDLSIVRPIPDEKGVWFAPGMIVLVEGVYEEDGSNASGLGGASGVGGQIKGVFRGHTIAGPPAERRDFTLGISNVNRKSNEDVKTSAGAGFGWVDFLGVGSERAQGVQMRRVQKRVWGGGRSDEIDDGRERKRAKVAVIGECNLDSPRTLEAIKSILAEYNKAEEEAERPLSIVLMGNFISSATMAGSATSKGSIEYKEAFDSLASILSEFPTLLASVSFVFVPGDNDAWASSFTAGAASAIPKENIPEIFTSRIRRAVAAANSEMGTKDSEGGEAMWMSNPCRMSLFGPVEEIVLFRDDITGRLRRNAVTFAQSDETDMNERQNGETNDREIVMEADVAVQEAASHVPTLATSKNGDNDTAMARKLVKTILDQAHLSPFPLAIRPVLWGYASSLALYPLPTALVIADAEAAPFALTYEGCHVMNPGTVVDELGARKRLAKWVEYDVRTRRGLVRDIRF